MREPNFSESQLQQAVNTALIQEIVRVHGVWSFAHVPSLIAEFDLGWDTAFYFPWLPDHPSLDDEGCNFFLQYKLSGELTSAGALEWSTWNRSYFRFKIPHSTRADTGAFFDDYHQWDRLKALAARGYSTFYATNATLLKADLQSQLQAGTLLSHIPALDVRPVSGQHKHVTFTLGSTHFALHSEKEESGKVTLLQALVRAAESEQLPLHASIKRLIATLQELPKSDDSWSADLARLADAARIDGPRAFRYWRQYSQITYFIRKHLGAHLLWLPKGV